MQSGQPSYTAMRAAMHRAAHQVIEQGRVFADPLALPVLGAPLDELSGGEIDPRTRGTRLLIAARSRFAEDSLAAAVARGVRQYVLLGAGLDTFAHRNPFSEQGLRVFEVDHPATQAWKRERLAAAGLPPPPSLCFAPVDFERQTLAEGLQAAGFDRARPAVFAWLGVVIYLTREAVLETLRFIATLPAGTEVIFDYSDPPAPAGRSAYQAQRAARVAARGEPWITHFAPAEIAAELTALGFDELEDLGPAQILRRFLGVERPDGPGAHLMRAARRLTRP